MTLSLCVCVYARDREWGTLPVCLGKHNIYIYIHIKHTYAVVHKFRYIDTMQTAGRGYRCGHQDTTVGSELLLFAWWPLL